MRGTTVTSISGNFQIERPIDSKTTMTYLLSQDLVLNDDAIENRYAENWMAAEKGENV